MWVTRKQYDILVGDAEFVANVWLRMTRQWSLGGIYVTGREELLTKLRKFLAS